ncbi:DNA-directed 5'-3' RNA polymerase [Aureococcus anophagefferens]|nr:DNA-directed 5'-3' RNA polymerase [Aureococcus anophagefferens]
MDKTARVWFYAEAPGGGGDSPDDAARRGRRRRLRLRRVVARAVAARGGGGRGRARARRRARRRRASCSATRRPSTRSWRPTAGPRGGGDHGAPSLWRFDAEAKEASRRPAPEAPATRAPSSRSASPRTARASSAPHDGTCRLWALDAWDGARLRRGPRLLHVVSCTRTGGRFVGAALDGGAHGLAAPCGARRRARLATLSGRVAADLGRAEPRRGPRGPRARLYLAAAATDRSSADGAALAARSPRRRVAVLAAPRADGGRVAAADAARGLRVLVRAALRKPRARRRRVADGDGDGAADLRRPRDADAAASWDWFEEELLALLTEADGLVRSSTASPARARFVVALARPGVAAADAQRAPTPRIDDDAELAAPRRGRPDARHRRRRARRELPFDWLEERLTDALGVAGPLRGRGARRRRRRPGLRDGFARVWAAVPAGPDVDAAAVAAALRGWAVDDDVALAASGPRGKVVIRATATVANFPWTWLDEQLQERFADFPDVLKSLTLLAMVEVIVDSPFDGIDVGSHITPALADLDGDGDLDLVVGEYNGNLNYYENVGSAASPSYEAATGTANPFDGIDVGGYSRPALVDLDGDGDLDLVVGASDGVLYYYENVGSAASPSYAAVTGTANPFDGIDVGGYSARGSPSNSSAPALADVDGDGDLDLVVGEYNGGLYYYENVGSAASPSYAAVTGTASPFDGINVDSDSAPALAVETATGAHGSGRRGARGTLHGLVRAAIHR